MALGLLGRDQAWLGFVGWLDVIYRLGSVFRVGARQKRTKEDRKGRTEDGGGWSTFLPSSPPELES